MGVHPVDIDEVNGPADSVIFKLFRVMPAAGRAGRQEWQFSLRFSPASEDEVVRPAAAG